MPDKIWGATPDEWLQLDTMLGLTEDLLPVVSNLTAVISPKSSLKGLGKTPSIYNKDRQACGITKWTSRISTDKDILRWSANSDYGICIQTRTIRAIDIDDPDQGSCIAAQIQDILSQHGIHLPTRTRSNSKKCLLAFSLPGDYRKRKFDTQSGIIEFLATGQQFIAAGTHSSGVRYQWDSLDDIPTLSPDIFEEIWNHLELEFAVTDTHRSKATQRQDAPHLELEDPIVDYLYDHPSFLGHGMDGQLFIECPFKHEHTQDSGESETAYFPAGTRGYTDGRFVCVHAHCQSRSNTGFELALGMYDDLLPSIIEYDLDTNPPPSNAEDLGFEDGNAALKRRYEFLDYTSMKDDPPPPWIIKNVLPRAELAAIYGESGSGKSFLAIDMALAIARGYDWNNLKTRKGRVAYIVAEGAGGFVNRIKAYEAYNSTQVCPDSFFLLKAAPNFLQKDEAVSVCQGLVNKGKIDVVFVDTFAQVTPGGNENAGEDVGKALAHCKAIHRRTGALVVLVHHAGKDLSRGLRGWSGLKGALDANIEVQRNGHNRAIRLEKLKEGEDGLMWGFELHKMALGVDADGDPITSCAFELTGTVQLGDLKTDEKQKAPAKPWKGEWQDRAVDVFRKMLDDTTNTNPITQRRLLDGILLRVAEHTSVKEAYKVRGMASRAVLRLIEIGVIIENEKGFLEPSDLI